LWAGNNHFKMQFSSIPTLVDAYVQAQLQGQHLKNPSLFLYVATKNPLVLEDATRIKVTASEDDLQAYFQSYDKIAEGSNICLDNVEVHLDYGKGFSILNIELSSKSVITDVGNKESKLKNFELKVTLEKKNGQFPLAVTTFHYLRRMERQELMKKNYKPSKVDILNFVKIDKKAAKKEEDNNSEISTLDTESILLLKRLLKFTDKEELFRVLIKKPLKDKQAKKAVRLSIIPTDVESEAETFEVKKKQYLQFYLDITETQFKSCSANTKLGRRGLKNDDFPVIMHQYQYR